MSMAAQTSYNFGFPKGVAGGLFDLSAHEVSTRQAEGDDISFGIGVVVGTNAGTDVTIPTSASTASDFEGVVVHNSVMVEMDMNNHVSIDDKRTVGCLHHGKIWVKTGESAAPAYKEAVYLITDGEEAGMFTTSEDVATKVAVNAVFLGETDDGIANAEFFPAGVKSE
ncbi:MAG: hypothetical protein LUH14_10340 [Clostridiaceae bacterium]|nr:hypothetical protein [Clostridiaceae bacterium]